MEYQEFPSQIMIDKNMK